MHITDNLNKKRQLFGSELIRFVILICKKWKKSYWLFHILHNNIGSMENSIKFRPDPKLRLMDQVRQVLRYHHYAYRTEQT
jgi:hypothetical protein